MSLSRWDESDPNGQAVKQLTFVVEQQIVRLSSLDQNRRGGKILMMEVAPRSFLCLVQGRQETGALFMGNYLFVFLPGEALRGDLPRGLTQIFNALPPECQQHLNQAVNSAGLSAPASGPVLYL